MPKHSKLLMGTGLFAALLVTGHALAASQPLSGAEARSMQGKYPLENGQVLYISVRGRHLYAQIGDGRVVKLEAHRESSELTSGDGTLAVKFDTVPYAHEVVRVTLLPGVRVSAGDPGVPGQ
jgi:hypothetical protein